MHNSANNRAAESAPGAWLTYAALVTVLNSVCAYSPTARHGRQTQGATLLVSLQPDPISAIGPPLRTVLFVTFDRH